MAEQEKKLKDSQNQIANGKSQLEEQSKIQKENLVNAEVELQSAKIKLELLASQLASQGMNKETLNKAIEETSKSLKDAESKLNDLQNELNNPAQNNEEYIMQIQARITVLNTTIENLKKGNCKDSHKGDCSDKGIGNIVILYSLQGRGGNFSVQMIYIPCHADLA